MSLLDKLEQLKTQMMGYRGELDISTEKSIEQWHKDLRENQQLMDFLMSPGGKILSKKGRDFLLEIDNELDNLDLTEKKRDRLLAYRKAWVNLLGILLSSPNNLKTLESQIDYQLRKE